MRKRFFVTGLIMLAFVALGVFAMRSTAIRQNPQEVKTQQATVRIFNNTSNKAWVNVPIEITSLGDNNYQVTNRTKMGIKRFIIALYAPNMGEHLHVEGAVRHYVPIRITDKPIAPGASIDLNIAENLKEFSSGEHQHADMKQIEMMLYIVEFSDESAPGVRWKGGKYLRLGANGWEEDPDLNPKENKDLIGAALSTASCYVYAYPVSDLCLTCNTGDEACDTPYCKRPIYNFKTNAGGVHLANTCGRCTLLDAAGQCDEFGIQCAHGDGSPCNGTVLDLDYNNPC